ncbi:MAG: hypothetical protein ACJAQ6_001428 [Arenicella sp.]|jgi:uncharacterized protein YacL
MAYKHGEVNIMNNDTTYAADKNPLDALFARARLAQPNLMDDNFTKLLVNKLPTLELGVRNQTAKKGLSFDLIGAVIGLLMAYLFIDKMSLLNSFVALIPESIVISPLVMVAVVGAVVLSSAVAWWAVEDDAL